MTNIDKLDEMDMQFLSNLWQKSLRSETSFKSNGKQKSQTSLRPFNLDSKLLTILKSHYENLRHDGDFLFRSTLNLAVQPKTDSALFENESDRDDDDDDSSLLHAFDVNVKLKWPHFLSENNVITLPPTQIYTEQRTYQINVTNPSNYTVIMEIGFLNG